MHSFAQKNFVSGYFVTVKNDTISCLINDQNWKKNPKQVQYRITENGDTDTFKPAQIKSFGLSTGDVFEGKIVSIDNSTNNVERLSVNGAPTTTTDTVFLKVLVKGAANLFYLYNGEREHFYYQTNAENLVELGLTYSLQFDPVTGKRLLITDSKYRGQLKTYFADCSALTEKLLDIKYSVSDMRAAFKQYNTCRNNNGYVSTEEKARFDFGVLAGASFTNLSFTSAERVDLARTKFKSPVSFNAGISVNMILPRNRQRWSFYNELLWKSYTAQGNYYQTIDFAYEHRAYNTEFSISSFGLGSMIRYNMSFPTLKPFVSIGVANNLILHVKEFQSVHVTYDFSEKEEYYERVPVGIIDKHELGALVGAGVSYKKTSLEARGEVGSGFTRSGLTASHKTAIRVLFGYHF
ncbi:outer membrane beta-barrel protein [Rufibacter tibetensis]|uniref:outer membrane beta-barrel protein n=1 Tax=Rufibacter tibetensis TaxID=512763 RepID=UPI0012FB0817|nr:outer membrane beta-barrel protein [Rufibacter tibetensis]